MRATARGSTGTIKAYLSITGNLTTYSTSDLFPYCCFKTAGLGTNQGNPTVTSISEMTYREQKSPEEAAAYELQKANTRCH